MCHPTRVTGQLLALASLAEAGREAAHGAGGMAPLPNTGDTRLWLSGPRQRLSPRRPAPLGAVSEDRGRSPGRRRLAELISRSQKRGGGPRCRQQWCWGAARDSGWGPHRSWSLESSEGWHAAGALRVPPDPVTHSICVTKTGAWVSRGL